MQYASGEWQPMETNEAFWLSLRVSLSLLGASILVALRSPVLHFLRWLCSRAWCGCVRTKEVNARLTAASDQILKTFTALRQRLDEFERMIELGGKLGYRKERKALRDFEASTKYSVFISHVRSKANFLRENDDPALRLPPAYTAERAIAANSVGVLYYVLLSSRRKLTVIATALAKALLSASLAPWAWYASTRPSTLQLFLAFVKMAVDNLISHYSFFPIFLLLGLLSYVTARWREWHVNCHIIQAAFHNIGLLVGMSITAEPDEETKALVYDLYRYLNAVHKILYQSVTPHLECLPSANLVKLGLLTQGEMALLEPTGEARDTVLTWAAQIVDTLVRKGKMSQGHRIDLAFQKLRGSCAEHGDLFLRNMPNSWFAASRLLVDILILLMLLELPLSGLDMSTYNGYDEPPARALAIHCVVTVVSAFIAAFAYGAAWSVVALLNNPFAAELDSVNVDPLKGETEGKLFAFLRAGVVGRGRVSRAAREPLAPSVDDDVRPLGANPETLGSFTETSASDSVTCVDVSISAAIGRSATLRSAPQRKWFPRRSISSPR